MGKVFPGGPSHSLNVCNRRGSAFDVSGVEYGSPQWPSLASPAAELVPRGVLLWPLLG